ncbi:MAG: hypothetical protein EBU59_10250 [Planctomycetia bacterium]|nr:hypothetical protein [Planctomycetia bacterium]
MRRALEIATQGPAVGENPRVGCVLLSSNGDILAEGFHRGAGSPHAEVEALTALADKGIAAEGTTAVVTLEPCNHRQCSAMVCCRLLACCDAGAAGSPSVNDVDRHRSFHRVDAACP